VELVFEPASGLAGEVRVPGDKSITHRAYLLGAIAEGVTRVVAPNLGADCAATRAALEQLGVRCEATPDGVRVHGRPDGFAAPRGALDLANSGTGMRLLAGVLAGRNVEATLIGDASLSRRPMARVVEPLRAMGGDVEARGEGGAPPLHVRGTAHSGRRLRGVAWRSPVASAQVKSAVLLAGLAAEGSTAVEEPLTSRDHTERLLEAFGVPCARGGSASARGGPASARVEGPATPRAIEVPVPGDFSSAFFWLVAGTIVREGELVVRGVGVNPTRTGALAVLERMGARVVRENERSAAGEPVADLRVAPARLRATDVEPGEVPSLIDELPALAVAQAFAAGTSTVRGAGELRVKESDRVRSVVEAIRALGGTAEESADGWSIAGRTLGGGTVESAGDHRIALAFGVAGLGARGPVRVLGAEMIDTSYPGFYNDLRERVTSR
jgi:3-phosphoshikimate 1-carboxyvinyltransferase